MFRYATRLDRDLSRWQSAGWVSPGNAAAIRADMASQRSGFGLAGVLATLAAVLFGVAVMSFVAANWQTMSKAARLGIIFAGLWSCLGLAAMMFRRDLAFFGHAALLAASTVFGAGIMLISQMYHMDGHAPDAVWLWGIGTVAAGLLVRSNPTLAAALVIFCVLSAWETTSGVFWLRRDATPSLAQLHWGFLPVWALVAAGIAITRWQRGLHLLAIALAGWLIVSGYGVGRGDTALGHGFVFAVGMAFVAASILFGDVIDRWRRISGALLDYGLIIAYAAGFALQFIVWGSSAMTWVVGALALAVLLAMLLWAWNTDNRRALWITYTALTVEIFALYMKKIGSLLGTSAFFFGAAAIVAATAYAAYRLHDSRSREVAS